MSPLPPRRPRLALALALSAAALAAPAVVAPAAHAAWFPGDAIDGPSADIESVGDVDLARDGTGAVVYLKRDAGVTHVYLSRNIDGAWRPLERVDTGLGGTVTAATVAAGDGRRLMVSFVSDGKLYGVIAAGGGALAPLSAPQLLSEGSPGAPVTDPHADLGINGTGYVVFSVGGDVRAVRLQDSTWEAVAAPLDVDLPQTAGQGAGRPRIAVSAEGNAVATWGESAADGRGRVFARRVTELTPSSAPQEVSLPALNGAAGGLADSPDIDVEDDGSYAWVTWRQDFGGVSRTIARRLVGSLFEAPTLIDGTSPSRAPRFEMNGRGVGASVSAGAGSTVLGGTLSKFDEFGGFGRLDSFGSGSDPAPVVAVSERRQVAVAWRREPGGGAPATIQARFRSDEEPFEAETTVSVPAFGTVEGDPQISADKNGDFAVAFVQRDGDARRLVVAVYDDPPPVPFGRTTTKFQRRAKPTLRWEAGSEVWGPRAFKVAIDGVEVATTDKPELTVPAALADGTHRWQVTSVDRRGQAVVGRSRVVRVDSVAPRLRVSVSGTRKRNRTLKISVSGRDGKGSGLGAVSVDYGDRSTTGKTRRTSHRYRRSGTFSVKVRAKDRAGNVARKTVRLRIGR